MAMPPEQLLHHTFLHFMEKNKIPKQAGLDAALSIAANIGIDMCAYDEETVISMLRGWIAKVREVQKAMDTPH